MQKELNSVLGSDPLAELDLNDPEAAIETLAVEYCRLFIGPQGHMPPVESVVRGEERFWGKSTQEVMELYQSWGFEPKKEAHTFPDHISMELDCLAFLEEMNLRDQAELFAHKHILQWLPILIKHIDKQSMFGYYPTWAKGLQTLLEELYVRSEA